MKRRQWKKLTQKIFSQIEENGYHVENIEYLNGYFIFEHGNNTVVHFNIKECKGWKFGIWWDSFREDDEIHFDFFTQYEKYIDKFKPSASTFVLEDEDLESFSVKFEMIPMFNFISKHPHVARRYDITYIHNPWDYSTPFEAWKKNVKDEFIEFKRNLIVEKMEKSYLRTLKAILDKELVSYKIKDWGNNCFPKYSIFTDIPHPKKGYYSIENLEPRLEKLRMKHQKKFNKYSKKYCKINDYNLEEIDYYARKEETEK